jgi:hypothetical protein
VEFERLFVNYQCWKKVHVTGGMYIVDYPTEYTVVSTATTLLLSKSWTLSDCQKCPDSSHDFGLHIRTNMNVSHEKGNFSKVKLVLVGL